VRAAWDASMEGVRLLQQRIVTHAIARDYRPGYLTLAIRERKRRAFRRWIEHMREIYDYPLECWIANNCGRIRAATGLWREHMTAVLVICIR
jgi:hypothetical protein